MIYQTIFLLFREKNRIAIIPVFNHTYPDSSIINEISECVILYYFRIYNFAIEFKNCIGLDSDPYLFCIFY